MDTRNRHQTLSNKYAVLSISKTGPEIKSGEYTLFHSISLHSIPILFTYQRSHPAKYIRGTREQSPGAGESLPRHVFGECGGRGRKTNNLSLDWATMMSENHRRNVRSARLEKKKSKEGEGGREEEMNLQCKNESAEEEKRQQIKTTRNCTQK